MKHLKMFENFKEDVDEVLNEDIDFFKISKEDKLEIGKILGWDDSVLQIKATRFILGLQDKLKNWNYDEVINYGEMHKVKKIFDILDSYKVNENQNE